jgi:phosphoglycerol transferase MdoB-like AlkP superfamily enzyme
LVLNQKIEKLYWTDIITMVSFLIVFSLLLIYIAWKVLALAPDALVRSIILIAAGLIITFGLASSMAVLIHLKKNQRQVYVQELLSYEKESKLESKSV